MKTYQWKSARLKKKSNIYNWLTLLGMLLALASIWFLPEYMEGESNPYWVAIIFMAVAFVFLFLTWRTQSEDRKLKK